MERKVQSKVNFVIALFPEAKPIIEFYDLKPLRNSNSNPFKIYENQEKRLVISGVGKTKSAKAVEFLYQFSNHRHEIWLNVGIAGHADRPVGEAILAHKITDCNLGKNWYPSLIFDPPCDTASILTVNQTETRYEHPFIYEMEASGFYGKAVQYSTAELIHAFKIISDNLSHSSKKVTPRLAERVIQNNLNLLDQIVQKLTVLKNALPNLELSEEKIQIFLDRWHFTVSQRHQLRKFLKRLFVLEPKNEFWPEMQTIPTSKSALEFLEKRINSLPVLYD